MALTIGRRGAPALCILGRPYSLGGTATVLHINFLVSLGNVENFTAQLIWRRNLDVGSLFIFLYVAGSKRLRSFSLIKFVYVVSIISHRPWPSSPDSNFMHNAGRESLRLFLKRVGIRRE